MVISDKGCNVKDTSHVVTFIILSYGARKKSEVHFHIRPP